MSCIINFDEITEENREIMNEDLHLKLKNNKYGFGKSVKIIEVYGESKEEDIDYLHIPFSYGYNALKLKKRPNRKEFPNTNICFEGTLRNEQKKVKKEAIISLNKTGCILISMYTGGGKTATSINIACCIKMKTLVIVNKIVLMNQWKESILKFCPNSIIQKVTTQSCYNEDADFYIMNAINVSKKDKDFFNEIGCVIVDEAHLIMAETLSKSLENLRPKYLIGLTATPYRPDGLHILLEYYFGQTKIIRKLYRKHTVYKVNTGFVPEIKLTMNGKINWNVILDSQANDVDRNQIILDIVMRFSSRTFLIITKRITQGKYLFEKIQDLNEDVTSLLGKQQEFEHESRILIGTTSKVGVGFDHTKLDALILASDVEEYFIQYLGRVFRTKEVEPIIFDLVDNNSILKKHYMTRRNIYINHGGVIKSLED